MSTFLIIMTTATIVNLGIAAYFQHLTKKTQLEYDREDREYFRKLRPKEVNE